MLPTLSDISHSGWNSTYRLRSDPWGDADRLRGSVDVNGRTIDVIRFNRIGNGGQNVIVNHGGPLAKRNEGWRYFFDPELSDLVFPLQYEDDIDRFAVDEAKFLQFEEICSRIILSQRFCSSNRSVLVGSSWGATVSLCYAARYPDTVSAVICASPFMPTVKSLRHMVSLAGGFQGNRELFDRFYKNYDVVTNFESHKIFLDYFYRFRSASKNVRDLLKSFSCVFYASMGDIKEPIRFDQIPDDCIDIARASAFCFYASRKRPFFIDYTDFVAGLRRLKERKVPIHIVLSEDDKSSDPDDIREMLSLSGAVRHTVRGGHSSAEQKSQIYRIATKLKLNRG
jgi:pimeloyl-ACP methyl ester carboxylesterase